MDEANRVYERPDYEPEPRNSRPIKPQPFTAEWRALPKVRLAFWSIVIPIWVLAWWGLLTTDIPMEPF